MGKAPKLSRVEEQEAVLEARERVRALETDLQSVQAEALKAEGQAAGLLVTDQQTAAARVDIERQAELLKEQADRLREGLKDARESLDRNRKRAVQDVILPEVEELRGKLRDRAETLARGLVGIEQEATALAEAARAAGARDYRPAPLLPPGDAANMVEHLGLQGSRETLDERRARIGDMQDRLQERHRRRKEREKTSARPR